MKVRPVKLWSVRGFTLLEIMVALAVAAVGLGAIAKAMSQNVNVAQQLEDRTLANWVASNRMAELRMQRLFRSGGSQRSGVEFGRRKWTVEEEYFATADPNITRVKVSVFADTGKDHASASETGYLARYKPAKPG